MYRVWYQITAFRFCCPEDEHISLGKDRRNALILVSEKNDGFIDSNDRDCENNVDADNVTNLDNADDELLPRDASQNESDENDATLEHFLPDTSTWTHRPIFIQPIGDTKCPGHDSKKSLPIGIPIDFESDLFVGKILFRFRDGPSDDKNRCDDYFQGANYNIKRQVIFQGRFKTSIKWSEVYYGEIYDEPLKIKPPKIISSSIEKIVSKLAPGIIVKLRGKNPAILALIGSACHTISIDKPGQEPDITSPEVHTSENTFLSKNLKASFKRKRVLSAPSEASQYMFDTHSVYTFHTYDEFTNHVHHRVELPIVKIGFKRLIGNQPLNFRAPCDLEGKRSLFWFRLWHESVVS